VLARSWGIDPIGDPAPERAAAGVLPECNYMWNAGPILFDDQSILYLPQENGGGDRPFADAARGSLGPAAVRPRYRNSLTTALGRDYMRMYIRIKVGAKDGPKVPDSSWPELTCFAAVIVVAGVYLVKFEVRSVVAHALGAHGLSKCPRQMSNSVDPEPVFGIVGRRRV
jgi:hypothetical protein